MLPRVKQLRQEGAFVVVGIARSLKRDENTQTTLKTAEMTKLTAQASFKPPLYDVPLLLSWLQPSDFPHKLGICERLFGKAIAQQGICWVQTGAAIPWKLDLRNPTHRWIVYGKYEGAAFLNWAKKFLPSNGVVVDSGANIGQMALYLAQYVSQGTVLAFEPGKAAADWLEECLKTHPALPIELIRSGLGSSAAHLRLQPFGSTEIHGAWSQISETEGEPVRITQLSDELASRSIAAVDLWKLDVEGYEIPALQGAKELLQAKQIKALYVEMTGNNGLRIREYLSTLNYRCHLFSSKGQLHIPTQFPDHTNGLFLPS
jgi:FkbM family methyltransferase